MYRPVIPTQEGSSSPSNRHSLKTKHLLRDLRDLPGSPQPKSLIPKIHTQRGIPSHVECKELEPGLTLPLSEQVQELAWIIVETGEDGRKVAVVQVAIHGLAKNTAEVRGKSEVASLVELFGS